LESILSETQLLLWFFFSKNKPAVSLWALTKARVKRSETEMFYTILHFEYEKGVYFMPARHRVIEDKIKEIVARKAQFENELKEAGSELERLQNAVVKGTADTDSLVAAQIKVNTIEQTISRFDLQLHALDADLISQKELDRRKEIFSKIKILDDEAEKAGRRFIELYSAIKLLSYARFVEMGLLVANIEKLKSEFGQHISALIPDVNKLKRLDLPELQNELDTLIADLQKNDCKLSVLRASGLFSSREYVTDDDHAFRLPENDLSGWIWLSIRAVREYEQQQNFADAEKTGMFQRILDKF
jgi:F0F1-type ATP synthase membrane subunit b/b'